MVSFSIFNNVNFIPLRYDTIRIDDHDIRIDGELEQPCSFAEFSFKERGKYLSAGFVIDSGENSINLELFKGTPGSLKIKSDAKGSQIFDEMVHLFSAKAEPTKINGYYKITRELNWQILQDQLKALQKHTDQFGALLFLHRLGRTDYSLDYAKAIIQTLGLFNKRIRATPLANKLYDDKNNLIYNTMGAKIGAKARTFTVNDIRGEPFSNASLNGQNYMIVFSATWCGPCQEQLPRLKEIYEKYKGFKVVYFNNDDDTVRWKKHVDVNKLDWINVSERLKPSSSKIQRSFWVYAIPTCLLVNRDGMIVYNSDEMDKELEKLEEYIKQTLD